MVKDENPNWRPSLPFFVLAKKNYNVYTNAGLTKRGTSRLLPALDTSVGCSFICKGMLPIQSSKNARPVKVRAPICDARNRTINTIGTMALTVELETLIEMVLSEVVERLTVHVIL